MLTGSPPNMPPATVGSLPRFASLTAFSLSTAAPGPASTLATRVLHAHRIRAIAWVPLERGSGLRKAVQASKVRNEVNLHVGFLEEGSGVPLIHRTRAPVLSTPKLGYPLRGSRQGYAPGAGGRVSAKWPGSPDSGGASSRDCSKRSSSPGRRAKLESAAPIAAPNHFAGPRRRRSSPQLRTCRWCPPRHRAGLALRGRIGDQDGGGAVRGRPGPAVGSCASPKRSAPKMTISLQHIHAHFDHGGRHQYRAVSEGAMVLSWWPGRGGRATHQGIRAKVSLETRHQLFQLGRRARLVRSPAPRCMPVHLRPAHPPGPTRRPFCWRAGHGAGGGSTRGRSSKMETSRSP